MVGLVVHDWLETTGGAERVADKISDIYPDADVFCLWNDASSRLPGHDVRESLLARTPLRRHKSMALPFMPLAWRKMKPRRDYEWILACTHLFAHHVPFHYQGRPIRKYLYIHTPARYIWTPELDPRGRGVIPRIASPLFRVLDRHRAQESFKLAANSKFVGDRVKEYWQRDAEVIYPPVDVETIQAEPRWNELLSDRDRDIVSSLPSQFLLGASRFVTYKRLDLVIKAGEACDIPVVLAGAGPQEAYLRDLASKSKARTTFVIRPTNTLLFALYELCIAFVYLGVEDFGIMPVEAMALGKPAIVSYLGGPSETVVDGITGSHVRNTDPVGLRDAVERAVTTTPTSCRERASHFSGAAYARALRQWMNQPA